MNEYINLMLHDPIDAGSAYERFLNFFSLFRKQLEPVHQDKHSSSAVEVTTCFSQVRKIWLQLAWPDSAGAFIFITRLTDVSNTSTVRTFTMTMRRANVRSCE